MWIPVDILKIIQASAVLLKCEPSRRMTRLRLLKYLYIAERESIIERARPITGDRIVAMDHGPVLSTTYDMIKGSDYCSKEWEKFIHSEQRDVHLHHDPGVGKLSRYEIQKLQDVSRRFANDDDWAVAEATHGFEEWLKNKPARGKCRPITLDDVLKATGLFEIKSELLENESVELEARRLFHQ